MGGRYILRVFAKRVSDSSPKQLFQIELTVTDKNAEELQKEDAGIYFDWGPDQQAYQSHVEVRPTDPPPDWLLKSMGIKK